MIHISARMTKSLPFYFTLCSLAIHYGKSRKIQCACGTAKGSKPAQKSRSDPTGTEALDPEIKIQFRRPISSPILQSFRNHLRNSVEYPEIFLLYLLK